MASKEPDPVAMTHFTSQTAAAAILDGWRHEILEQDSASKFGPKELSLRLYSRYGMNDPTEYLHEPRKAGDGSGRSRLVFPDTAFIYCGAKEIDDEALDRLDLWRAYGADGHGIAITTIWRQALDAGCSPPRDAACSSPTPTPCYPPVAASEASTSRTSLSDSRQPDAGKRSIAAFRGLPIAHQVSRTATCQRLAFHLMRTRRPPARR